MGLLWSVVMIKANDSNIKQIILTEINKLGSNADLNHIDVFGVTDMSSLFKNFKYFGDISNWDVSNVTDMANLFANSTFNGDISKWNTKNVIDMNGMFYKSQFDSDISQWNVSNVIEMGYMFTRSKFNSDISKWNVGNVTDMVVMFGHSEFRGDISKWNPTLKDENDLIIKVIDRQKLLPPFNPPKHPIDGLSKMSLIKSLHQKPKKPNDPLYEESWREYHDNFK